jgi:hypothetical protein
MANGILGTAAIAAVTDTTVYTVPADTFSVVSVNVVNRGTSSADVRIAIAATGTPSDAEYVEYDTTILPSGVVERTGIVLDATKNVVVRASTGDCSAQVYGLETAVVSEGGV